MNLWLIVGVTFFTLFIQNSSADEFVLPEIQVLGRSAQKGAYDLVPTVSKISGNRLERKKQNTVGETLAREPGVNSSYYGPNASRPIIRGLDGEKIKILENGVSVTDASGTSPDHAVSTDPLVVDSIEIVRGPSALLYGSGAIGGVVNLRNLRIANRLLEAPELKIAGKFSSVDRGRSVGVISRTPLSDSWILEIDGATRGTEDYAIPGFARTLAEQTANPLSAGVEDEGRVTNSASRFSQLGLGISHVDASGFYGVAISGLKNRYGTISDKAVQIDIERFRLDFDSEFKSDSFFHAIDVKAAASNYRHEELEGSSIGTTFRNRGGEIRVDAKHRKTGAMEGLLGLQAQYFDFSAKGEEAFLPTTHNLSTAAYIFEEWKVNSLKPSIGFRADRASVASIDPDLSKFSAATTKTFFTPSAAIGLLYQLSEPTSFGLNLTYTERAPNYQELFSNGVHVATRIYESGNVEMPIERGLGAELSWRYKEAENEARMSVFAQQFSSFLTLSPTGTTYTNPDNGETADIYNYNSVEALLFGAELELKKELPLRFANGRFELEAQLDFVRGLDRTRHDWLPRMSPFRETLALSYLNHGYLGMIEIQRSEKQSLLAANERPTDAYTFFNLGFEAPINTDFGGFRLTAKINNLFDHEGRVATSFLKEQAPLPGRNVILGLQAAI